MLISMFCSSLDVDRAGSLLAHLEPILKAVLGVDDLEQSFDSHCDCLLRARLSGVPSAHCHARLGKCVGRLDDKVLGWSGNNSQVH